MSFGTHRVFSCHSAPADSAPSDKPVIVCWPCYEDSMPLDVRYEDSMPLDVHRRKYLTEPKLGMANGTFQTTQDFWGPDHIRPLPDLRVLCQFKQPLSVRVWLTAERAT